MMEKEGGYSGVIMWCAVCNRLTGPVSECWEHKPLAQPPYAPAPLSFSSAAALCFIADRVTAAHAFAVAGSMQLRLRTDKAELLRERLVVVSPKRWRPVFSIVTAVTARGEMCFS